MPHVKHVLLIGHDRVGCSLRAPQVRHLLGSLASKNKSIEKNEQLRLGMQLFYALLLLHNSCKLHGLVF